MQGYTGLAKKVAIDHYFSGIAAPFRLTLPVCRFRTPTEHPASQPKTNQCCHCSWQFDGKTGRESVQFWTARSLVLYCQWPVVQGFWELPGSNSTRRLRHRSPAESNEKITPAVSLECEPLSAGATATKALRDYLQNLRVQYLVNH